ncbi:hypothetical protein CsatB_022349 [Cannabis sativa]
MAGIFLVAFIILMMMQLNTVHAVEPKQCADFKSPPPPPRAPPAPGVRRAPTLHF